MNADKKSEELFLRHMMHLIIHSIWKQYRTRHKNQTSTLGLETCINSQLHQDTVQNEAAHQELRSCRRTCKLLISITHYSYNKSTIDLQKIVCRKCNFILISRFLSFLIPSLHQRFNHCKLKFASRKNRDRRNLTSAIKAVLGVVVILLPPVNV